MSTSSELNANDIIRKAIREIALHGLVNQQTGAFKNTSKISGYIVKIHDDINDELFGTVDVQEYNVDSEANRQAIADGLPVGLHEGVYLSALKNNENGVLTVPYLNSDVVIATDPDTLREYVIQYSHADKVQLDAHNKVVVGVTETEEYEKTLSSPDVENLAPTGIHAHTTYTTTSAFTTVGNSNGRSGEQSSFEVAGNKIQAIRDQGQFLIDAKQLLTKYNAKEIVIRDDGVYVGSGSASEPAVLGNQLASLLTEWLGCMSEMVTSTAMGPQPPTNIAKFVSLQAKIKSYQAAISGFLSKNVKISQ